MGIFDVFKKKQSQSDFQFPSEQNLELPPPPPSLEETDLPKDIDYSNLGLSDSLPDSGSLPDFDDNLPLSNTQREELGIPTFPEMPNLEQFSNAEKEIEIQLPTQVSAIQGGIANSTAVSNYLFIVIEEYKEIMTQQSYAKSSLKTLNDSLNQINAIRAEEEREFVKWHSQANDILRKLTYVDKILFEKSLED